MVENRQTNRILLGLVIVLLVLYGWYNSPNYSRAQPLTEPLAGTYVDTSSEGRVWIAIDHEESTFYYTDQINSWYIQGTVQKNSEGQYWLHCPQKDSQVILPEQILKLRNGLLTVQIAGAELIFTKNSEAAVTLNDVTYR